MTRSSSEIKPGRVWKDRTGPEHIRVDTVSDGVVHYTWAADSRVPNLNGSRSVDAFLRDFEITPDLSKVKAGDTVTLDVSTEGNHRAFTITGEVYELGPELGVGGWSLTGDGRTLTAHQPAPEPEPEWKPGMLADITINGNTFRAVRVQPDDGSPGVWSGVPGGAWWDQDAVTDVRPLVVIDPASDYVQGLIRLAHDKAASPEGERDRALVRDVLKGLGIEAP